MRVWTVLKMWWDYVNNIRFANAVILHATMRHFVFMLWNNTLVFYWTNSQHTLTYTH